MPGANRHYLGFYPDVAKVEGAEDPMRIGLFIF